MERLERMFNEAAARAAPASARRPLPGESDSDDDKPDPTAAERIVRAHADGDFFTALGLPLPDCDDAGKPVWDVPDGVVSKAFRKASLRVHPDKNPSEEAKIAFDKLSDANRALRDPARRGEALRKFATKAFNEKCRLDPGLMLRAKKAQERRDAEGYHEEIQRQQEAHRERIAAMKAKAAAFRKRHREDDDDDDDASVGDTSSDDDDEEEDAKEKERAAEAERAAKKRAKAAEEAAAKASKEGGGGGGNGRKARPGARKKVASASSDDDDDDAGLARPVLGAKGRGKPKFIM